jgi:hypothetical protein
VADRLCVACDHGIELGIGRELQRLVQALVFKRDGAPYPLRFGSWSFMDCGY